MPIADRQFFLFLFPVFNVISHGLNLISHKIIYFIWGGKNSQKFKQNPCFNQ